MIWSPLFFNKVWFSSAGVPVISLADRNSSAVCSRVYRKPTAAIMLRLGLLGCQSITDWVNIYGPGSVLGMTVMLKNELPLPVRCFPDGIAQQIKICLHNSITVVKSWKTTSWNEPLPHCYWFLAQFLLHVADLSLFPCFSFLNVASWLLLRAFLTRLRWTNGSDESLRHLSRLVLQCFPPS